MQILDILRTSHDGALDQSLAKDFGLETEAAQNVTKDLVTELSRALERNTLSRGGVSDLVEMIGNGHHARYLDAETRLASPETKQTGDRVLAQILGSKHESRGVATRVARHASVEAGTIEKILPAIAAMFMGGVEQQVGGQLGDLAQRFGGGDRRATPEPQLAPQQPLPIPGDTVDYGGGKRSTQSPLDDLSDMIRRGGRSFPGGGRTGSRPNGSILGTVVREIFGNVLGFQSKGIVGWLIRLIVVRWGWSLLKSIARRIFLGR